ncbi:MAG: ABC transporter permease [Planctomycetia bacterium]
MRGSTFLAWAWLRAHPGRSLLVAGCTALILLLPLALGVFVARYAETLGARAAATPLVLGAPGSRFDLVLAALHFRGRPRTTLPWSMLERVAADPDVEAVPLHVGHTARGAPVVGTSPDYHRLRGLVALEGTLPLRLGEATVGAALARSAGLAPGQRLLVDAAGLFQFGLRQPLALRVVGVLAPTGTADDAAVFVDVKTCWVLDGLGHLHADPAQADPSQVLARDGPRGTVLAPSVVEATEISPANEAQFHLHGDPATRPLSAVLVVPRDARAATIVKGRYRGDPAAQVLDPAEVTEELLGTVFRIKAFFDAHLLLVGTATGLLLGLVVLLTLRVRAGELATLARLGASRAFVARMLATEWLVLLGAGALGALALGGVLLQTLLPGLLP